MWIRLGATNNDPKVILLYYLSSTMMCNGRSTTVAERDTAAAARAAQRPPLAAPGPLLSFTDKYSRIYNNIIMFQVSIELCPILSTYS